LCIAEKVWITLNADKHDWIFVELHPAGISQSILTKYTAAHRYHCSKQQRLWPARRCVHSNVGIDQQRRTDCTLIDTRIYNVVFSESVSATKYPKWTTS
jgi:hypothetical protein